MGRAAHSFDRSRGSERVSELHAALGFPPESEPVFMRESQPGVARKGFSFDEEDTSHDRSDY